MEYSEELLNPANISSIDEAEHEDSGEALSIFLAAKVGCRKLFGGKVLGVEEIRLEMLKALLGCLG